MNVLAVLAVLIGALASSACTTLSPKEATPEELRRQLLSGELLVGGVGYSVIAIVLVALAPALIMSGG